MKKLYKLSNKFFATALLVGLLSGTSSAVLKERTFYSADKSKSFAATLTGFNEEKGQVRVRTTKGRDMTFKLGVLSEECQTYVSTNASKVAVASSLDISFKEAKSDKSKGSSSQDYRFDVTFYNKSETILENVAIDYTVYYKKDNIVRGKKVEERTSTGTFDIAELDPNYRTTASTKAIPIVKKTIKSKGGG